MTAQKIDPHSCRYAQDLADYFYDFFITIVDNNKVQYQ